MTVQLIGDLILSVHWLLRGGPLFQRLSHIIAWYLILEPLTIAGSIKAKDDGSEANRVWYTDRRALSSESLI